MVTHPCDGFRRAPARTAIFACLLLQSCAQPPVQPVPPAKPPAAAPTPSASIPEAASRFRVDPARTAVEVVVRRAGALSRFGHDHVITSTEESGTVWIGDGLSNSGFTLRLPVAGFDVDLPEARAAAGPEFAAAVPPSAREGTRENMLRPEVLDGNGHPTIEIRSVAASGNWPDPTVRVSIDLKGVERAYDVPVHVTREAGVVSARGTLDLRQSDFRITPFSVAGGAIQVADALRVEFQLVAAAAAKP
jgi:polyisoprenoid-binding protein YceI